MGAEAPRGRVGRIIWPAVAAIGAPVVTAVGAYTAIRIGVASHSDLNMGTYAATLDPLEDHWMLTSVWIAAGAGFPIAAMTLAFGKRPPWFAGVFGLLVGTVAGLGLRVLLRHNVDARRVGYVPPADVLIPLRGHI